MPHITINLKRIDWPSYQSFSYIQEKITLQEFMELYPALFVNSKKLFVNVTGRWIRVFLEDELSSNGDYRLVSVVDAHDSQQERCKKCSKSDIVSNLRYHTGTLISQKWVHGMTISWEWTCCNRIVQHPQIERFDAPTGCNIGLCAECRNHDAYEKAISKRKQEEDDAF